MHGSTGGGWKRNAPASPRQLPTQPTSATPSTVKSPQCSPHQAQKCETPQCAPPMRYGGPNTRRNSPEHRWKRSGGEEQDQPAAGIADHQDQHRDLAQDRGAAREQGQGPFVCVSDAEQVTEHDGRGVDGCDQRRGDERRVGGQAPGSEPVRADTEGVGQQGQCDLRGGCPPRAPAARPAEPWTGSTGRPERHQQAR